MWYIYLIKSSKCDEVYIGSTSRSIKARLSEHIYQYNVKKGDCSVNKILIHGTDDIIQEVVEEVDTIDRKVLRERERWWIENTPNCVNVYTPIRSREEALDVYNMRAKERRKTITNPVKCACGFTYYYGRKEAHDNTRRHKAFIKLSGQSIE